MTQPAGEYDFIHRIVSTSPIPVDMSQHPDSLLSFCARTVEEKRFSVVWRRRTSTIRARERGVRRGAVHRKGGVEMRGGGAATLAGRRVREEKHAVILVLE